MFFSKNCCPPTPSGKRRNVTGLDARLGSNSGAMSE
jgi:hypothetical protein